MSERWLVVTKAHSSSFITKEESDAFRKHVDFAAIIGPSIDIYNHALQTVIRVLRACNVKHKIVPANKLTRRMVRKHATIVTVGGDGTVLHVAKYADLGQVIIPINSNPKTSVGHLTRFDIDLFVEYMIKHKPWQFENMYPLTVTRNGTKIAQITNDFLFSNENPAEMSKYAISRYNLDWERQMSSGVWVSTIYGSTAAIKSAGFDSGCDNPPTDITGDTSAVLFKVREPYQMKEEFRFLEGILNKASTSLNLIPAVRGMCLWLDGAYDCVKLNVGDKIRVSPYTAKEGSLSYRLAKPHAEDQNA